MDRERLRTLAENATEGPWETRLHLPGSDASVYPLGYGIDSICIVQVSNCPNFRNDRDFIAEARSAVPDLLDALDQAEAERDALAAALREVESAARGVAQQVEDEFVAFVGQTAGAALARVPVPGPTEEAET